MMSDHWVARGSSRGNIHVRRMDSRSEPQLRTARAKDDPPGSLALHGAMSTELGSDSRLPAAASVLHIQPE